MTDRSRAIQIGVISVREDEYVAVLERMPNPQRLPCENRTYFTDRIATGRGTELSVAVVRTPEQGPGFAQDTTRDLIEDLHPTWLALVGICGAIPDRDFTLGDVVVASRLHDFTVGAHIESHAPEFTNQGGPMKKEVQDLVASLPGLRELLAGWETEDSIRAARPPVNLVPENFYGDEEWRSKVLSALRPYFETEGGRRFPYVTARSIASSGYLIKDAALVQQWLRFARDLVAVEMELSGVYIAARRRGNEYPILAIRGISDIVGFKRDPQWTGVCLQQRCIILFLPAPKYAA